MKVAKLITLILCLVSMLVAPVQASRIKDIASVQGIRDNQLIGYGLVVGLPGTGEQTPFTDQTFRTMLGNFGINIPAGERPKINNVAAVAVTANIPPFAKPGQKIDVRPRRACGNGIVPIDSSSSRVLHQCDDETRHER